MHPVIDPAIGNKCSPQKKKHRHKAVTPYKQQAHEQGQGKGVGCVGGYKTILASAIPVHMYHMLQFSIMARAVTFEKHIFEEVGRLITHYDHEHHDEHNDRCFFPIKDHQEHEEDGIEPGPEKIVAGIIHHLIKKSIVFGVDPKKEGDIYAFKEFDHAY